MKTYQAVAHPEAAKLQQWWIPVAAVIGFVLGWLVWQYSETLTGDKEPWDGSIIFYFTYLFVAGFLLTLPPPHRYQLALWGMYFGQVACMEMGRRRGGGAVILPPVVSVAVFGVLPAWVGARLACMMFFAIECSRSKQDEAE